MSKKILKLFGYCLFFLLYYFFFAWILYILKIFNVLTPHQVRLVELLVSPIIFIRVMYKYLIYIDLNQVKNIKANFCPNLISLFTIILLFILSLILSLFILKLCMYYSPSFYQKYLTEVQNQENCLVLLYKDLSFKPSLMIIITNHCISPALCEEFLFRGILQNIFMEKIKKPLLAITFSALLFSIAHFMPYAAIELFLSGLLYGSIYYVTNSLLLSMLVHFLDNITSTVFQNYLGMSIFNKKEIETCLSPPLCIGGIIICLYLGFIGFKFLKLHKKTNTKITTRIILN